MFLADDKGRRTVLVTLDRWDGMVRGGGGGCPDERGAGGGEEDGEAGG